MNETGTGIALVISAGRRKASTLNDGDQLQNSSVGVIAEKSSVNSWQWMIERLNNWEM